MLETLTADRIYYVRTDGSDTNDGLSNSAAGAFKTIQYAYDLIADSIFLAGHKVTIQIGEGTFPGLATGKTVLGANYPEDVLIKGTSENTIVTKSANNGCFEIGLGFTCSARIAIENMTLTSTGYGILAFGGGIHYRYIWFGACSANHVQAAHSGWVYQSEQCTVKGNALSHLAAATKSVIATHGTSITFRGPVGFSGGFAYANDASIYPGSMTFYNPSYVSGRKFVIDSGAIKGIGSNINFLPGDAAGIFVADAFGRIVGTYG